MPAQKDAAGHFPADRLDRGPEALLIALRAASRWGPLRTRLSKRQIASQHRNARSAERIGHGYEQRGTAIGSGPVGKHETVVGPSVREMKESADWDLRRSFREFSDRAHAAALYR
jgi:hypothetical protein